MRLPKVDEVAKRQRSSYREALALALTSAPRPVEIGDPASFASHPHLWFGDPVAGYWQGRMAKNMACAASNELGSVGLAPRS